VPIFILYRKQKTHDCLGYIRSPYVPSGRRGFGKKSPKKTLYNLKNKKNSKSHHGKRIPIKILFKFDLNFKLCFPFKQSTKCKLNFVS